MKYYILAGDVAVEEPDLTKWGKWFETHERQLGEDWINPSIRVSTIFLGLDHGFQPSRHPVLFETMVFGGIMDGTQLRYCFYQEAIQGHEDMVRLVRTAEEELAVKKKLSSPSTEPTVDHVPRLVMKADRI